MWSCVWKYFTNVKPLLVTGKYLPHFQEPANYTQAHTRRVASLSPNFGSMAPQIKPTMPDFNKIICFLAKATTTVQVKERLAVRN